jgi:hypothetical protein
VRISQLLTDIDEVGAIELDPLHVETSGVVALDVRVRVEKRGRKLGFRRFAIRPIRRNWSAKSSGTVADC